MSVENPQKIRLVSVVDNSRRVLFDATPTLTESAGVNYDQLNPVHMPGGIQIYRNTSSRQFSISTNFFSRNSSDIEKNKRYLRILRSWRMPYFGINSVTGRAKDPESEEPELLGAPPEVLYFYAYSSSERPDVVTNINKVPVVLSNLEVTYYDNIDYLPVEGSEPFPVKLGISISLQETHSPKEFERFSLADYREGRLVNF